MVVITAKQSELNDGKLSETHVKKAVEAIRVDGCVIIENIINHKNLDIT